MPSGNFCACGCGVTPTNYRKKFKEAFPNGYPFVNTGLYYCGNCPTFMPWCKEMHIDHIKPKNVGGENCINNLRPLCFSCNCQKQDELNDNDKKLHGFNNKHRVREITKKKHWKNK